MTTARDEARPRPYPEQADDAQLEGVNADHNDAWQSRFLAAARNGNWKSDMIWYRVVDNQ